MAVVEAPNMLIAVSRKRAAICADVPPELLPRYYVDGRGGPGLGSYPDRQTLRPVIRDYGRALRTDRSDRRTVADTSIIAQKRSWTTLEVRGEAKFRREAWLSGTAPSLDVVGYRPTQRDHAERARRRAEQAQTGSDRLDPEAAATRASEHLRPLHERALAAWAPLRVIQTWPLRAWPIQYRAPRFWSRRECGTTSSS